MKSFIVTLITVYSFNSFATNDLKEQTEDIKPPSIVHVYCSDGSYAGSIYDMGAANNAEMAEAMCN